MKFTTQENGFRKDINGLRALAVSIVIFYHFGLLNVSGGFIGVDIFFVISGFLMTGIIMRSVWLSPKATNWQIAAPFYLARIRRIVPAASVMCFVLMLIGWNILLEGDFRELASETISALFYYSNILFWRESGYFDVASQEKWLLHTWSLSVEWQFYIAYPLFLLFLHRFLHTKKRLEIALLCVMVLSLVACILLSPTKSKSTFFMLPTRGWEMLAGGIVFFRSEVNRLPEKYGSYAVQVSIIAILASIFLIDSNMLWPGYLAIVPVAATSIIIFSSQSNHGLLSNRVAQWVGTRSYSLYLWHWPVVVGLAYIGLQDILSAKLVGFAIALVLGSVSYQTIERSTIRLLQSRWKQAAFCALFAFIFGITLFCVYTISRGGISGRFAADIVKVAAESSSRKPRQAECFATSGAESPACIYGGNNVKLIVVGDSHAAHVLTGVVAAAPDPTFGVLDLTYAMCPTIDGAVPKHSAGLAGHDCPGFRKWLFSRLDAERSDIPVLIVNRTTRYAKGHNEKWEGDENIPSVYFTKKYAFSTPEYLSEFSESLVETVCKISKKHKVFVVQPIPEMGVDVPRKISRSMIMGYQEDVSISLADYMLRHAEIRAAHDRAAEQCGVTVLDPIPYMCHDGRCFGSENGFPLYSDDNHLSEFGNKKLTPMFTAAFNRR
jgi:peptidoglycan/LPS O-acetylase OafA/YrhL